MKAIIEMIDRQHTLTLQDMDYYFRHFYEIINTRTFEKYKRKELIVFTITVSHLILYNLYPLRNKSVQAKNVKLFKCFSSMTNAQKTTKNIKDHDINWRAINKGSS